MKKLWAKKAYMGVGVVFILFSAVSLMSLSAIRQLQGNARVVNYVGIVRGATQKLVKEELMGWQLGQTRPELLEKLDWYPDDALIDRLDSIVEELLTGVGSNELVVLNDEEYLLHMRQVQNHWGVLKTLIAAVREGANPQELFESSQVYFELVNDTVFSAESYSERQVDRINSTLIIINTVFILLILIGLSVYINGIRERKRADALGKIAYVDPMTGIDNRASCERLLAGFSDPEECEKLAVFMFDMNNLKLTNDFLGHQGGDRVITSFAGILRKACPKGGFVGRFGGDEFLVVLRQGTQQEAENFLSEVKQQVDAYNEVISNNLERIHYAAGYYIAAPAEMDVEDIVHEADNRMYEDKRRLKKQQGSPIVP